MSSLSYWRVLLIMRHAPDRAIRHSNGVFGIVYKQPLTASPQGTSEARWPNMSGRIIDVRLNRDSEASHGGVNIHEESSRPSLDQWTRNTSQVSYYMTMRAFAFTTTSQPSVTNITYSQPKRPF